MSRLASSSSTGAATSEAATVSPKFPPRLQFDPSTLPKLDGLQAGHLRHFHNSGSQKDGDWNFMGEQIAGQVRFK